LQFVAPARSSEKEAGAGSEVLEFTCDVFIKMLLAIVFGDLQVCLSGQSSGSM
jgi:hypothetical protein